jgi:L-iditol 2-dehydrogenase
MLQAQLLRPGKLELTEAPVPEPGPGELLVRIDAALTCGTDLKMFMRGHPRLPVPAPFGHEFAGTVAGVGTGVTRFRAGDAIASVPTAPCGICRLCLRGRENLCAAAVDRITLGAFSEYLVLPEPLVSCNVFPRPSNLGAEEAAALEPVACVVHGASRIDLANASSVVVLGDGPIALLFVQLARLRSTGRVLVAGKHPARLQVAARLGADTTTLSGAALQEHTRELLGGADIVIECVGKPELWEAAQSLAAPGGEVLLYGGCPAGTRAAFDTYTLHYEEVDLKGAFHYTRADVRAALEVLESGRVTVKPLITHHKRLFEIHDAMSLALQRDALKVAVIP